MNKIRLAGEISEVKYSYTYKGMDFYKSYITAHRQSGNTDTLPVILPPQFKDIQGKVCLKGEIRTRNVHTAGESHLDIFVYVKEVETYTEDENLVIGEGYLCKEPNFRITPLLRCVCDLLVACNREYGKSAYIPSIAWGHNADKVNEMSVGTHIQFEGRLQSRLYVKEGEERTAYELSMSRIEEMEDNENERPSE